MTETTEQQERIIRLILPYVLVPYRVSIYLSAVSPFVSILVVRFSRSFTSDRSRTVNTRYARG